MANNAQNPGPGGGGMGWLVWSGVERMKKQYRKAVLAPNSLKISQAALFHFSHVFRAYGINYLCESAADDCCGCFHSNNQQQMITVAASIVIISSR